MKRNLHPGLLLPLLAAVLCLWFFTALQNIDSSIQEGSRQLEDSLRRAAIACYAAEGVYPPDLQSLVQYGGIRMDEDRYTVHYEVFAENLMPDITVLVNES